MLDRAVVVYQKASRIRTLAFGATHPAAKDAQVPLHPTASRLLPSQHTVSSAQSCLLISHLIHHGMNCAVEIVCWDGGSPAEEGVMRGEKCEMRDSRRNFFYLVLPLAALRIQALANSNVTLPLRRRTDSRSATSR